MEACPFLHFLNVSVRVVQCFTPGGKCWNCGELFSVGCFFCLGNGELGIKLKIGNSIIAESDANLDATESKTISEQSTIGTTQLPKIPVQQSVNAPKMIRPQLVNMKNAIPRKIPIMQNTVSPKVITTAAEPIQKKPRVEGKFIKVPKIQTNPISEVKPQKNKIIKIIHDGRIVFPGGDEVVKMVNKPQVKKPFKTRVEVLYEPYSKIDIRQHTALN